MNTLKFINIIAVYIFPAYLMVCNEVASFLSKYFFRHSYILSIRTANRKQAKMQTKMCRICISDSLIPCRQFYKKSIKITLYLLNGGLKIDKMSVSHNRVCSLPLGGLNFVLNFAEWMAQIYR